MNLRPNIIVLLTKRYGLKCWYCGVAIRGRRIHVDHVKAKSRGGLEAMENFALACRPCNFAKGDMSLREFFIWIRRIRNMVEFPATDAFDEDYSDARLPVTCEDGVETPNSLYRDVKDN